MGSFSFKIICTNKKIYEDVKRALSEKGYSLETASDKVLIRYKLVAKTHGLARGSSQFIDDTDYFVFKTKKEKK